MALQLSDFLESDEEREMVSSILTAMGYSIAEGSVEAVKRDLQELEEDAFMESLPSGTGIRQKATFKRFLKLLAKPATQEKEQAKEEPAKEEAAAPEDDLRFHAFLHYVPFFSSGDLSGCEVLDKFVLDIRVIFAGTDKFLTYRLKNQSVAKVYAPEGSLLEVRSQLEDQENERETFEILPGPDDGFSLRKGGNVYVLSRADGKSVDTDVKAGFPLEGRLPHQTVVVHQLNEMNVHTFETGQEPTEFNRIVFGANPPSYTVGSQAIAPDPSSVVYLHWIHRRVVGRIGNSPRYEITHLKHHFPASKYSDSHVYLYNRGGSSGFNVLRGSKLSEPYCLDASADFAKLMEEEGQTGEAEDPRFHVVLHNPSIDERFRLKVQIRSLDDTKLAKYGLQSLGHATVYLPKGAVMEVQSQLEDGSSGEEVGHCTIATRGYANGSHIYLWSRTTERERSPEEQKWLCLAILCLLIPPIGILLCIFVVGPMDKKRKEKPRPIVTELQAGPPCAGPRGRVDKTTIWHHFRLKEGPGSQWSSQASGDRLVIHEPGSLTGTAPKAGQASVMLHKPGSKVQIVARNQKKEQVDLIAASTAVNHHMYVHHHANAGSQPDRLVVEQGGPATDKPRSGRYWDVFTDLRSGADADDLEVGSREPTNEPTNQPVEAAGPPGQVDS